MKKRKLLFFKAIMVLFAIGVLSTSAWAQPYSSEVALRNDTLLSANELQVDVYLRSTLGGAFYYGQGQHRFSFPAAINGATNATGLTASFVPASTEFTNAANVPTTQAALAYVAPNIIQRIAVTSIQSPQEANTLIPMNSIGLRHFTWKLTKTNGNFATGTTVTWGPGSGAAATAIWYHNGTGVTATTVSTNYTNCNNPVISPITTSYTLSGGTYCSSGTGATITLNGSETGVRYQLYKGASKVGGYVAGTGSALTWTNMDAGVYTVFAWRKATYISYTFTGGVVTAVSPVAATPISGSANVVQGSSNVAYSVVPDPNATYYTWYFDNGATGWSIDAPGNTAAITVDFTAAATSGTLHVSGGNTACGLAPDSFFDIFLSPALNTWTGAVSTIWGVPGNWSNNAIPGASDAIDIPVVANLPVIPAEYPALCGAAEIHNGASITIAGSLTASGIMTLDGGVNLIVNNGGSLIDNGFAGTGTANVQKSLANGKWHYFSAPISDATSNVVFGDWLAPWDCALQAWGPYIMATTYPLNGAEGYATYTKNSTPALKSFAGHLNTGVVNHVCANGGASYFCLVGNAYPSAIDLSSGAISWPGPSHTAYFWDPNNMTYKIYTTVGATHTKYAPSVQGFFIEVPAPGSFTLANAARTHNSEAFLKSDDNYPNVLQMNATNLSNNYTDVAVIGFVEGTTNGYDYNYDAAKLANGNEAPSVFSWINDQKVAYNIQPSLTESTVVPMGFTSGISGNVTFNAENLESFDASVSIYLEDLKEGTIQNLKSNPSYSFAYNTGDNANRFVLHFSAPTSIGEHASGVQIYSYESSIYVKNLTSQKMQNVFVYDLLGQEVFRSALNQSPIQKFNLSVNSGYYLVKVVTENGVTTQKVYIY